jgi:hypothetical protein
MMQCCCNISRRRLPLEACPCLPFGRPRIFARRPRFRRQRRVLEGLPCSKLHAWFKHPLAMISSKWNRESTFRTGCVERRQAVPSLIKGRRQDKEWRKEKREKRKELARGRLGGWTECFVPQVQHLAAANCVIQRAGPAEKEGHAGQIPGGTA